MSLLRFNLSFILLFGLLSACADDSHVEANASLKHRMGTGTENSQRTLQLFPEQKCTNPCTFKVKSDFHITKVIYEADGFYLNSSSNSNDDFSISYSFNTLGFRHITAMTYNEAGQILASTSQTIEVSASAQEPELNPEEPSESPTNRSQRPVPYFYQYDNRYSPGSSCQNTSMAMLLQHYNIDITPDEITLRYGKDYAQSPAGLADLSNRYFQEAGVARRLVPTTTGSLAGLKAALDRGHPVIVHGYFTSYGHVLVITGYDANGYYVNDPAGRWNESFKGGYTGYQDRNVGRGIYYSRRAFESAIATSDGYNSLPLWYHELH